MFDKIFDDTMFDMIVKFTNQFAQSKVQSWVDVTMPKMKVFFALCIFISIVKLSDIYNYWRTKHFFHIPAFREDMPRTTWLQIYRNLHVCDEDDAIPRGEIDHYPLYKIRPLFDHLLPCFRNLYNINQNISIDESVIQFKGRIYFRQYIPSKCTGFGIKAWVPAESDTGYVSEFSIHTGKSLGNTTTTNLAVNVVKELTSNILDLGYHLYMNNY